MPTTIVDVVELPRESIEMKRKNATMPDRQTDLEAQLVEALAAKRTMRIQITTAEGLIKALNVRLADAQLALEKLANEWSKAEANLLARTVAAEESLGAETAAFERFERELAT